MANDTTRYTSDFWDCRDFGHAWTLESCVVVDVQPLTYERSFKCSRGCDTHRKEQFVSGHLGGRGYKYPTGYQVKGLTVKQRSNFRDDLRNFNLARQARGTLDATTKKGRRRRKAS